MYAIKKHSLNRSYTSFPTFTEIKSIAKMKVILINIEIRFKTAFYIFSFHVCFSVSRSTVSVTE